MIRFNKNDNSIYLTKGNSGKIIISLNEKLSVGDEFLFTVTSLLNLDDYKIAINTTDIENEKGYCLITEKDNKSIITIVLTPAATIELHRGKYAYNFTIIGENGEINTFQGGDADKCLFYLT